MSEQDIYVYAVIALLTLCTFLTRAVFLLFGERVALGEETRRALRYAPAAALTAIIVPELLPWNVQAGGFVVDERLIAALIAVWVYLKTKNAVWLIVSGMVAFWCIRAVVAWI